MKKGYAQNVEIMKELKIVWLVDLISVVHDKKFWLMENAKIVILTQNFTQTRDNALLHRVLDSKD